jgi:hypothetical protein
MVVADEGAAEVGEEVRTVDRVSVTEQDGEWGKGNEVR